MGDMVRRTPGGRVTARRRLLLVVSIMVAAMAVLAGPAAAVAASGSTTKAVTTYTVNVDKNEIDVTVTYTIKNSTSSKVKTVDCGDYWICTQTTSFYYDTTYVEVDAAGSDVSVTSNAGKVSQAVYEETSDSRILKLTYPPVWYGQTRVVTAKYAIPAGPRSSSGFRAVKAYASLCLFDNMPLDVDAGSVDLVLPDGFTMVTTSGASLTPKSDENGLQTFSSGTTQVTSCVVASNPAGLAKTTSSAGDSTFDVESWPEDESWAGKVDAYIATDLPRLEELTGLTAAAGPYTIKEAGSAELGTGAAGQATVPESASEALVIEAIGRTVYAPMFSDTWMWAGLAAYGKQVAGAGNYTSCSQPSGTPDLSSWQTLVVGSSQSARTTSAWQTQAACYIFTSWADEAGHDGLKAALVAASKGENPYTGAGASETAAGGPITARTLLDMIDERGMVPAGVADLDEAQTLLSDYGIFKDTDLAGRSEARARYHSLVATAGSWKMPLALRSPMAGWDFPTAQKAMDSITDILSLRDHAEKAMSDLELDGTVLQSQFEAARTQADLDAVLALAKGEADAADRVAEAGQLKDGSRTVLQTVGLLGTDLEGPLGQARTSLADVKPDDASNAAQTVIDTINKSGDQGTLRAGVFSGVLLGILLLAVTGLLLRRRRRRVRLAAAPVPSPMDGLALFPPAWALYDGVATASAPDQSDVADGVALPAPVAKTTAMEPPAFGGPAFAPPAAELPVVDTTVTGAAPAVPATDAPPTDAQAARDPAIEDPNRDATS
jgi:hypothetical protein